MVPLDAESLELLQRGFLSFPGSHPPIRYTRSGGYGVRDGGRFLAAGWESCPCWTCWKNGLLGGDGDDLVAWMQETRSESRLTCCSTLDLCKDS